jgi:hypothetical protein
MSDFVMGVRCLTYILFCGTRGVAMMEFLYLKLRELFGPMIFNAVQVLAVDLDATTKLPVPMPFVVGDRNPSTRIRILDTPEKEVVENAVEILGLSSQPSIELTSDYVGKVGAGLRAVTSAALKDKAGQSIIDQVTSEILAMTVGENLRAVEGAGIRVSDPREFTFATVYPLGGGVGTEMAKWSVTNLIPSIARKIRGLRVIHFLLDHFNQPVPNPVRSGGLTLSGCNFFHHLKDGFIDESREGDLVVYLGQPTQSVNPKDFSASATELIEMHVVDPPATALLPSSINLLSQEVIG